VRREQQSLGWRGGTVDPAAYDVSILTNPWVCAGDVPPTDYTHGVVYDMVPNLVSAQALDLVEFFDVTGFAHEHHLGYEFYERHARTLTCISDCTRRDLLRFYLRDECHRAVVDIPFDIADGAARVPERRHRDTGAEARILLVNPLDHRKNLVGIRAALLSVARNRPLAVSVVGRERVGWSAAETFFGELTGAGISVEWFRGASDDRLDALYAGSDVLLFPSLYEGLGLPILEAQAHGLPVVSASTSSCGEVNLNPLLATDPADHAAIAAALERSLSTGREVLRGTELRAAQDAFIAERGRGLHWGAPALAGPPAVGRSREAATSLAGTHS
jgi:glycosyltransferase involved in cell wall biosynthesis